MNTSQYVMGLIVMLLLILVIDLTWLGVVAKKVYAQQLQGLMRPKPLVGAAALFYTLFALGTLYFVVSPAVVANQPVQALLRGGLFGFFGYQLYDLTNYATLKNWPRQLVVIDIAWGTFLVGITSYLTTLVLAALV